MFRKSGHAVISGFIGFILVICGLSHSVTGQATPAQQLQPASKPAQPRTASLAHLYWHFLAYQNHLDTTAESLGAQGKDSSLMHNHLQKKLGFSDSDYAPIRISSVRLTAKVKDLDTQAATIRTAGASSSNHDQLRVLTVQREEDINSEIAYLKQNLSPDKIKAFEAFLTQFFSPNNAVPRPSTPAGQQAPAAVQK